MSTLNEALYDSLKLDAIIENAITDAEKSAPDFIIECEGCITTALLAYTKSIVKKYEPDATNEQIESVMEKLAGELLDVIYDISHIYIKNGMRLGANLLLQLLIVD